VTELAQEVESFVVPANSVGMWWLYQAGFVIKSPGGTTIVIDPYLSDAVMRSYGLPRAAPMVLHAEDMAFDAVLATHSHEDHLDPDSIDGFAKSPGTLFVGPPMATEKLTASGVAPERVVSVARGDEVRVGDITITAVFARHVFGLEPTPDAVGYVIKVGDKTIYHSGDTEYDCQILEDTKGVDVALICINGTTGNMNVHEAALLAWQQGARTSIPTHYGLWHDKDYGEGATIDPEVFTDTLHRLDKDRDVRVIEAGRRYVIDERGMHE
jgi:L-ascorbate 6-phosphate lactonase